MKALFDSVSEQCSKITTRTYSTSFSIGIRFLNKRYRKPIYNIYGFVRFADEIVDSFHGYHKAHLLSKFKEDTIAAIEEGISLNPIINSFQQTVHSYQIEWELIDTFLRSMEMDLKNKEYNKKTYEEYILGSAEVVGLMCLRVFTEGNNEWYEQLKPYAMKLGAAFQKVNFLRDAQKDFEALGRSYFPDVNLKAFRLNDKRRIEAEIEDDFEEALIGIKQLPSGAQKGVYLAYLYYTNLFQKIKRLTTQEILRSRISVPNSQKFRLMVSSLIRYQFNLL